MINFNPPSHVKQLEWHVSMDHGVTKEPRHAASVRLNIDELITQPLTEQEMIALNTRIRLRMVTKGFRDTPQGHDQLLRLVKDYLREIGKSNEGMIFTV